MKTSIQYWALCLSLLLPLTTWGQSDGQFQLSLRLEYEASLLQGFDLNDFYRSYNDYHSSFATQFFDTLAVTELSHPALGLGGRFTMGDDFGFSSGLFLTYGRKNIRREARFLTNIVTRTDLLTRDVNLQLDLGFHIQRKFFLHAHVAGRFRKNVFDLAYIYPDGSYSLGNEYDILGVYQSNTTTLDVGGNLAFKIKKIYIPIGISWPLNFASDEGILTLQDFDSRQARWPEVPRDFAQWTNDPANLDPVNDLVRSQSFQAIRLNIGIEYWFGAN
ncbi:MAG: hypothetical protein AAFN10_09750 [Bacteroidota bacterium]